MSGFLAPLSDNWKYIRRMVSGAEETNIPLPSLEEKLEKERKNKQGRGGVEKIFHGTCTPFLEKKAEKCPAVIGAYNGHDFVTLWRHQNLLYTSRNTEMHQDGSYNSWCPSYFCDAFIRYLTFRRVVITRENIRVIWTRNYPRIYEIRTNFRFRTTNLLF